jgi:hypothetical protein
MTCVVELLHVSITDIFELVTNYSALSCAHVISANFLCGMCNVFSYNQQGHNTVLNCDGAYVFHMSLARQSSDVSAQNGQRMR